MLAVDSTPPGIALLGFSERDKGILTFFLEKQRASNFMIVSETYADLCVLDLDGIDGQKLLQQQFDRHPHRSLIVLSVRDVHIDNVRVLRKPLRTDFFKSALEFTLSELTQRSPVARAQLAVATTVPISVPDPVLAPAPVSERIPSLKGREENSLVSLDSDGIDRRSALPGMSAQARIIHGSCGVSGAIDFNMPVDMNKLFYNPHDLFQGVLKNAIERCRHEGRPLHLELSHGKYVTLLPKANIALTNLSDTKLRPRCLLPMEHNQINIDYHRESETHLLNACTDIVQSIDALLWKVALWSARGRLPVGTNIDAVVRLQQWPNLTRLMAIPQFLRMAALWSKSPSPLKKTVELLNIEARYVCAFFSACCALELTHTLAATVNQDVVPGHMPNSAAPGGLLRRLLKRLRVA